MSIYLLSAYVMCLYMFQNILSAFNKMMLFASAKSEAYQLPFFFL